MPKILGLDVCKSSVAVCLLEEIPDRPGEWFKKNRKTIPYLSADVQGLQALLTEFQADIAVLEPTGIHYSTIWARKLKEAGTIVLWVGHAQLKYYRSTLRLPSKNDQADALALAIYGIQWLGMPEYFLNLDIDSTGATIRQLSLQLRHLTKLQNPLINRLRQNLSHECPEIASLKSLQSEETAAALWRYLADVDISKSTKTRYDRILENSIGFGISDFTREHAARLVELQMQTIRIEKMLHCLVSAPEFDLYNRVFDRFGFGRRIRALVLSYVYPLDQFLLAEKREHIEHITTASGKRTKRYRSLSAFKLALGFGLIEDSSGKSEKWVAGGSKICRIAIWQWIFTTIEPKGCTAKNGRKWPCRRPDNEIGQILGKKMDDAKTSGAPIKLIRSRIAAKAIELLFYELLKELRNE